MAISTAPTDSEVARSQHDRALKDVTRAQSALDSFPPIERIDQNEHRTLRERDLAVTTLAEAKARLDALPSEEALAARNLLERRDAAYYEAMGGYVAQARRDAEAVQARAREQFDLAVASETLSLAEVFETLLALLNADDDRTAAYQTGNFGENSANVPALIPSVGFSELVDQVIARRRARRGESARQVHNEAMNSAGVAASAKVK